MSKIKECLIGFGVCSLMIGTGFFAGYCSKPFIEDFRAISPIFNPKYSKTRKNIEIDLIRQDNLDAILEFDVEDFCIMQKNKELLIKGKHKGIWYFAGLMKNKNKISVKKSIILKKITKK